MEVERLTAVLEATGLSTFAANMAAADRVVGSTADRIDHLAYTSRVAGEALQKVKLVASQAAETGASADFMRNALAKVAATAGEAADTLDRVKLGSGAAFETAANGEVINRSLRSIGSSADDARGSIERMVVTAELAKAATAGGGSSGGGGGLLGALGWGGGNFGMAGFGSLLGLAGFGAERAVTTGLGLAGSLGGAAIGGGLLALGAGGTMAVGMGTDLAGIGQAAAEIKTVTGDMTKLQNAIQTYGRSSQQAASAQAQLNQDLGNFSPVARNAVVAASQAAIQFKNMFDQATGLAEKTGAEIINQAIKVGEKFLPTIGKYAAENMGIIQRDLQPLFAWLDNPSSTGGLGIFKNLEQIFQNNLPTSIHAMTQGVELFAKTVDVAAQYTGGFVQKIDGLLTRLNAPSEFSKWADEIGKLIGLFDTWLHLFTTLGGAIYELFRPAIGFGQQFAAGLTDIIAKVKDWLGAAGTQDVLKNLFAAHLAQLKAVFQILLSLLPALEQVATAFLKIEGTVASLVAGPFKAFAYLIQQITQFPLADKIIGWVGALLLVRKALEGTWTASRLVRLALLGLGPAAVTGAAEAEASVATVGATADASAASVGGLRAMLLSLGSAEVLSALALPAAALVGLGVVIKKALDAGAMTGLNKAGDLMPVKRNGVWVDPNTGKALPAAGQAYWNAGGPSAVAPGAKLPAGATANANAKYSTQQIYNLLTNAGFTPDQASNFVGIALAESGGRYGVLNNNPSTGDYSVGLFQENFFKGLGPARTARYAPMFGQNPNESPQAFVAWLQQHPAAQAKIAFDLFSSSGYGPWKGDAFVNAHPGLLSGQNFNAAYGTPTSSGVSATYASTTARTAALAAQTLAQQVQQIRASLTGETGQISRDSRQGLLSADITRKLDEQAARIRAALDKATKADLPTIRTNLSALKAAITEGLAQAVDTRNLDKLTGQIRDDLKNKLISSQDANELETRIRAYNRLLTDRLISPEGRRRVEQNIADLKQRLTLDVTLQSERGQLADQVDALNAAVAQGLFPTRLARQARQQALEIGLQIAEGTQAGAQAAKNTLAQLKQTIADGVKDATVISNFQTQLSAFASQLRDTLNQTLGLPATYASPDALAAAERGAQEIIDKLNKGLITAAQASAGLAPFEKIIESGLNGMEQQVSAAVSQVRSAFQQVQSEMDAAFQANTAAMERQLAVQYFQNGLQTPSEKLLSQMQAQDTLNQYLDAIKTAQASGDQTQIAKAQRDYQEYLLGLKAAKERAAADAAYTAQIQKLQAQRTQAEQQMNDALAQAEVAFENGTGSFTTLQQIAAKYGIVIDKNTIPDFGKLSSATKNLTSAIDALIAAIAKGLGTTPALLVGPSYLNRTSPNLVSAALQAAHIPSHADGGPTRAGLALLHDGEYVVPKGGTLVHAGGSSTPVEIHIHQYLDGREITETVHRGLLQKQRDTGKLGFVTS